MVDVTRSAIRSVRNFVVMIVVVTALAALNFFLGGCSSEPVAYYGPQPVPDIGDTADDVGFVTYYGPQDAGPPPDLPDTVEPEDAPAVDGLEDIPSKPDEIEPQVHYGPVPVDVVEDVQPELPQPIDVADGEPQDTEPEQIPSWYGPVPEDVAPDSDHQDAVLDIDPDCPPMGIYGPPPCDSDEMCEQQMGPNYYCDTDNAFDDGCGGKIEWPMCKEKD